jgi:hypothetical protein
MKKNSEKSGEKEAAKKITENSTTNESKQSLLVFERVKLLLERKNKNVEWLAQELGMKTKATLYTGFKKGTITIKQIESISKILEVHPFFLFEEEIIKRLTEEARKHGDKNKLSVREFLMSVSMDLSGGMKLEEAAYKNLDSDGHRRSLTM